jgi:5-methylcytosine-specific restriction endonuclease McrA
MTQREGWYLETNPIWEERIKNRHCPICGKNREDFDTRHKSRSTCCSIDCTSKWQGRFHTWQGIWFRIFKERNGICASCGVVCKDPWTLDHIHPIALGGEMWDPENLQILCEKCNKEKTARDLGQIAAVKRLNKYSIPDRNEAIERWHHQDTQATLFES